MKVSKQAIQLDESRHSCPAHIRFMHVQNDRQQTFSQGENHGVTTLNSGFPAAVSLSENAMTSHPPTLGRSGEPELFVVFGTELCSTDVNANSSCHGFGELLSAS